MLSKMAVLQLQMEWRDATWLAMAMSLSFAEDPVE
jgi:hypothetical protein